MNERRNSKAYIHYGNPATEEWELIAEFEVIPAITPDVSKMTIDEILKWRRGEWREIHLPNGENIEMQITFYAENNTFNLNVRQGAECLVQMICDMLVSVIFRTLKLAVMEIGYGACERVEA